MKKIHIILISAVGCASLLTSTGCSDDLDFFNNNIPESSNRITFAVAPAEEWTVQSRAGGVGDPNHLYDILQVKETIDGDTLYLHSEISDYSTLYDEPGSRGQLISSSGVMYDQLSVSACYYDDSKTWDWEDWGYEADPNFLIDETVVSNGSNTAFDFAQTRYWPLKGKVRFLAYGPSVNQSVAIETELANAGAPRNYWFDKSNQTVTDWTGTTHNYGPRMYVRVPNDAKNHQDLIVAYSEEISCAGTHQPVAMKFQHPLTGIRLICGDDMIQGKIKKITFKNVCRDGNIYLGMYTKDALSSADIVDYPTTPNSRFEVWSNLDDFTMTFDGDGLDVGPNTSITSDDNMFFMMPQSFDESLYYYADGKDVTLEIEFEHTNVDTGLPITQTLTTSLMGRVWPSGKIVTYKLSFKDQILEVEEPQVFSYNGYVYSGGSDGIATDTVAVNSINSGYYRDWNFNILDGGSSWLNAEKTADGKGLVFSTKDRDSRTPTGLDINANLKKTTHGSSTTPWNLSNSTGASKIMNTANCYMVDGAGTYILPMVYGNAIENGAKNQSAYYMTGAELETFKGHLGNDLWSPYIQSTWKTPTKAYVVWQDAQGLVTNVSLDTGYFGKDTSFSSDLNIYGVKFEVPSSTITQGNAILAVEDEDGNIMWSWHIWVTNFDFSSQVPEYTNTVGVTTVHNVTYQLMPVNLGWCSGDDKISYYQPRSARVVFTSGTVADTITVTQESHLSYPRGNQPYYQWGRKDPFVATTDGTHSKTYWDGAGTAHSSEIDLKTFASPATTRNSLADLIKHPDTWHIPPYVEPGTIKWGSAVDKKNALDVTYNNLWNNGAASGSDIKTIYDPCPPGYMVSNADAFTGLKIIHHSDNAELSESYAVYDKFQVLTFPISGYRDWADNGQVWSYTDGARGCVWSNGYKPDSESQAFNGSTGCAYYMNFTSSVLIPQDFYYTCDGFPVRPYAYK